MANSFITATQIAREFLRVLHSNCPFLSTVDRQFDDSTEFGGVKNGGSITVRKPAKYDVTTGPAIDVQDHENTSASLTIAAATNQHHVDVNFSSFDLTLNLDDFSKQFITPAAARLGAKIESYALKQAYIGVANSVGTPGTTPATALTWLQGAQKLDENLAPRDGSRYGLMNPGAQAATVDGLKGLFNPSGAISRQYTDGQMGDALGLKFNMGQLVPAHTTGTRTNTTPLVHNSALPDTNGDDEIVINGLANATDTIAKGDVFTIAGVYSVDEDGNSTGSLFQFVAQSLATASSNAATITVQPMYTTGKNKNISAFPINDAAVTFFGATASGVYPQNLVYHKDFYTFATVPLSMPKGVDFAAREMIDGISIRVVRQYDINNDSFPCRIDVLGNGLLQRPEIGCRVWG